jgi:ceramide glucosyltransferase
MPPNAAFAAALLVANAAWVALGLYALRRVRRGSVAGHGCAGDTRPDATPASVASDSSPEQYPSVPPPLSVLKPLAGVDAGLERALTSFFEQDHPNYELVFGVEGASDPAVAVVNALRQRYPHVPARLVVHGGGRGLNPKVSNLRAMLEAASHPRLLISDSNVLVPPHYLRETALLLEAPGTGLVTHLIAGTAVSGLGATLEALELDGTIAPAVAIAHGPCGTAAVIGKSMAFHRAHLERVGGFESVSDVLAEDYVLGRAFHEAGLRVTLAPTPVGNLLGRGTVARTFRRLLRWGMIRVRLNPLLTLLEPLQRPLVCALLGVAAGLPAEFALPVAFASTVLRDAGARLILGQRRMGLDVLVGIGADLLAVAAWACAWFPRHVVWRGRRVRVSSGTRLYGDAPRSIPGPVTVT